jgi:phosphoserine phosphatase RsbU/P
LNPRAFPRRQPLCNLLVVCLGLACAVPVLQAQLTAEPKPQSTAASAAQPFDATNLRQPADLDATWLVHGGDDPAFARPDFDDSKWLPFTPSRQSLHDLYPDVPQEVIWYRLHIKVDPSRAGLALQEFFISAAFDIYSNGVKLIQVGQVAPFEPAYYRARLLALIPDDQIRTGSIVIALRVHVAANEWSNAFPGFFPTNLTLGQQGSLRERIWLDAIGEHALDWLSALISAGLSLGALLLYTSQRRQQEYLWLFLLGLAQLIPVPLNLYGIFHTYPAAWYAVYAIPGLAIPYLLARMYFAFIRQRISWRFQLFLGLVCVTYIYSKLGESLGTMTINQYLAWSIPWIILVTLVLPGILLVHLRRGNREAGILLIPALLSSIYLIFSTGAYLAAQIPAIRAPAWYFYRSTQRLQAGPFQIWLPTALNILSALALALIILLRSNRQSRQQALLEGELEAAREVQQVILPEQVESVPGFTVESVYQPARQVGGDFFQILPDGDGGLLVVVGDVAGKGLPAAMLVSVLVGAIRTAVAYSRSPGEILAQLNERLMGRTHGGFSTALAARVGADGTVTIANAGHLSPYLDGREVELPGALPLGVVGNAKYETTQFCLAPGSRLTFYSDGVVEAQNQKGELFGFDRAKSISTQPAAAIVEAAVQFGQSDDITVVAIERQAAIANAA